MFSRNVLSQFFIVKCFSKSPPRNLNVATFINRYSKGIILLHSKQKLRVCLKVKIINTESHHALIMNCISKRDTSW